MTTIKVDDKLVEEVKQQYPEVAGFKATQIVEWLMRWAVVQAKSEEKQEEKK
jgi:hypothetical protein